MKCSVSALFSLLCLRDHRSRSLSLYVPVSPPLSMNVEYCWMAEEGKSIARGGKGGRKSKSCLDPSNTASCVTHRTPTFPPRRQHAMLTKLFRTIVHGERCCRDLFQVVSLDHEVSFPVAEYLLLRVSCNGVGGGGIIRKHLQHLHGLLTLFSQSLSVLSLCLAKVFGDSPVETPARVLREKRGVPEVTDALNFLL